MSWHWDPTIYSNYLRHPNIYNVQKKHNFTNTLPAAHVFNNVNTTRTSIQHVPTNILQTIIQDFQGGNPKYWPANNNNNNSNNNNGNTKFSRFNNNGNRRLENNYNRRIEQQRYNLQHRYDDVLGHYGITDDANVEADGKEQQIEEPTTTKDAALPEEQAATNKSTGDRNPTVGEIAEVVKRILIESKYLDPDANNICGVEKIQKSNSLETKPSRPDTIPAGPVKINRARRVRNNSTSCISQYDAGLHAHALKKYRRHCPDYSTCFGGPTLRTGDFRKQKVRRLNRSASCMPDVALTKIPIRKVIRAVDCLKSNMDTDKRLILNEAIEMMDFKTFSQRYGLIHSDNVHARDNIKNFKIPKKSLQPAKEEEDKKTKKSSSHSGKSIIPKESSSTSQKKSEVETRRDAKAHNERKHKFTDAITLNEKPPLTKVPMKERGPYVDNDTSVDDQKKYKRIKFNNSDDRKPSSSKENDKTKEYKRVKILAETKFHYLLNPDKSKESKHLKEKRKFTDSKDTPVKHRTSDSKYESRHTKRKLESKPFEKCRKKYKQSPSYDDSSEGERHSHSHREKSHSQSKLKSHRRDSCESRSSSSTSSDVRHIKKEVKECYIPLVNCQLYPEVITEKGIRIHPSNNVHIKHISSPNTRELISPIESIGASAPLASPTVPAKTCTWSTDSADSGFKSPLDLSREQKKNVQQILNGALLKLTKHSEDSPSIKKQYPEKWKVLVELVRDAVVSSMDDAVLDNNIEALLATIKTEEAVALTSPSPTIPSIRADAGVVATTKSPSSSSPPPPKVNISGDAVVHQENNVMLMPEIHPVESISIDVGVVRADTPPLALAQQTTPSANIVLTKSSLPDMLPGSNVTVGSTLENSLYLTMEQMEKKKEDISGVSDDTTFGDKTDVESTNNDDNEAYSNATKVLAYTDTITTNNRKDNFDLFLNTIDNGITSDLITLNYDNGKDMPTELIVLGDSISMDPKDNSELPVAALVKIPPYIKSNSGISDISASSGPDHSIDKYMDVLLDDGPPTVPDFDQLFVNFPKADTKRLLIDMTHLSSLLFMIFEQFVHNEYVYNKCLFKDRAGALIEQRDNSLRTPMNYAMEYAQLAQQFGKMLDLYYVDNADVNLFLQEVCKIEPHNMCVHICCLLRLIAECNCNTLFGHNFIKQLLERASILHYINPDAYIAAMDKTFKRFEKNRIDTFLEELAAHNRYKVAIGVSHGTEKKSRDDVLRELICGSALVGIGWEPLFDFATKNVLSYEQILGTLLTSAYNNDAGYHIEGIMAPKRRKTYSGGVKQQRSRSKAKAATPERISVKDIRSLTSQPAEHGYSTRLQNSKSDKMEQTKSSAIPISTTATSVSSNVLSHGGFPVIVNCTAQPEAQAGPNSKKILLTNNGAYSIIGSWHGNMPCPSLHPIDAMTSMSTMTGSAIRQPMSNSLQAAGPQHAMPLFDQRVINKPPLMPPPSNIVPTTSAVSIPVTTSRSFPSAPTSSYGEPVIKQYHNRNMPCPSLHPIDAMTSMSRMTGPAIRQPISNSLQAAGPQHAMPLFAQRVINQPPLMPPPSNIVPTTSAVPIPVTTNRSFPSAPTASYGEPVIKQYVSNGTTRAILKEASQRSVQQPVVTRQVSNENGRHLLPNNVVYTTPAPYHHSKDISTYVCASAPVMNTTSSQPLVQLPERVNTVTDLRNARSVPKQSARANEAAHRSHYVNYLSSTIEDPNSMPQRQLLAHADTQSYVGGYSPSSVTWIPPTNSALPQKPEKQSSRLTSEQQMRLNLQFEELQRIQRTNSQSTIQGLLQRKTNAQCKQQEQPRVMARPQMLPTQSHQVLQPPNLQHRQQKQYQQPFVQYLPHVPPMKQGMPTAHSYVQLPLTSQKPDTLVYAVPKNTQSNVAQPVIQQKSTTRGLYDSQQTTAPDQGSNPDVLKQQLDYYFKKWQETNDKIHQLGYKRPEQRNQTSNCETVAGGNQHVPVASEPVTSPQQDTFEKENYTDKSNLVKTILEVIKLPEVLNALRAIDTNSHTEKDRDNSAKSMQTTDKNAASQSSQPSPRVPVIMSTGSSTDEKIQYEEIIISDDEDAMMKEEPMDIEDTTTIITNDTKMAPRFISLSSVDSGFSGFQSPIDHEVLYEEPVRDLFDRTYICICSKVATIPCACKGAIYCSEQCRIKNLPDHEPTCKLNFGFQ